MRRAPIATFCSATYGVTFPMTGKVDVNGPDAHPLFQRLTEVPDASGEAGPVQWNFEKWLLAPDAYRRGPVPSDEGARHPGDPRRRRGRPARVSTRA